MAAQKGRLELILGPMFSGKTTSLLQKREDAGEGLLYKPSLDTRYDLAVIKTHDGKTFDCMIAEDPLVLAKDSLRNFEAYGRAPKIFLDEVQFFSENLLHVIPYLMDLGCTVTAAGLNLDYNKESFKLQGNLGYTMRDLMSLAHHVEFNTARCYDCGDPAMFTMKKGGLDQLVEVGASDLYVPACNSHWKPYTAPRQF